jgi:hypothetical protein
MPGNIEEHAGSTGKLNSKVASTIRVDDEGNEPATEIHLNVGI